MKTDRYVILRDSNNKAAIYDVEDKKFVLDWGDNIILKIEDEVLLGVIREKERGLYYHQLLDGSIVSTFKEEPIFWQPKNNFSLRKVKRGRKTYKAVYNDKGKRISKFTNENIEVFKDYLAFDFFHLHHRDTRYSSLGSKYVTVYYKDGTETLEAESIVINGLLTGESDYLVVNDRDTDWRNRSKLYKRKGKSLELINSATNIICTSLLSGKSSFYIADDFLYKEREKLFEVFYPTVSFVAAVSKLIFKKRDKHNISVLDENLKLRSSFKAEDNFEAKIVESTSKRYPCKVVISLNPMKVFSEEGFDLLSIDPSLKEIIEKRSKRNFNAFSRSSTSHLISTSLKVDEAKRIIKAKNKIKIKKIKRRI